MKSLAISKKGRRVMCLADNKLGEAVYYWSVKRTTQDMPVIAGRFSARKRHSYMYACTASQSWFKASLSGEWQLSLALLPTSRYVNFLCKEEKCLVMLLLLHVNISILYIHPPVIHPYTSTVLHRMLCSFTYPAISLIRQWLGPINDG